MNLWKTLGACAAISLAGCDGPTDAQNGAIIYYVNFQKKYHYLDQTQEIESISCNQVDATHAYCRVAFDKKRGNFRPLLLMMEGAGPNGIWQAHEDVIAEYPERKVDLRGTDIPPEQRTALRDATLCKDDPEAVIFQNAPYPILCPGPNEAQETVKAGTTVTRTRTILTMAQNPGQPARFIVFDFIGSGWVKRADIEPPKQ
jgi:hypothetical protein